MHKYNKIINVKGKVFLPQIQYGSAQNWRVNENNSQEGKQKDKETYSRKEK